MVFGVYLLTGSNNNNNSYDKVEPDEEHLSNIYSRLTDAYDDVVTYQAEFVQHNYWDERQVTLQSEGIISFTQEIFALNYSKPEGQRVIIDSLAYIIDENEKTMIIAPIDEHINPIDIINRYWNVSRIYITKDTGDLLGINLLPEEDIDVESISVLIRKPGFIIRQVAYEDFDGNLVTFTFENEEINKSIDDRVFELPSRTEYSIIDQTE